MDYIFSILPVTLYKYYYCAFPCPTDWTNLYFTQLLFSGLFFPEQKL